MDAALNLTPSLCQYDLNKEDNLFHKGSDKLNDLFCEVGKERDISLYSETASTRADDVLSTRSLCLSPCSKSSKSQKGKKQVDILDQNITLKDIISKRKYTRRNKSDETIKSKPTKKVKKAIEDQSNVEKIADSTSSTVATPTLVLIDGKPVLITPESNTKKELVTVTNRQNKVTTSQSFKTNHHTEKWTEEETRKFYRAVEIFGTDFSMIATLFPERNRIQIKNKYSKEERVNPQNINASFTRSSTKGRRSLKIFKRIATLKTNLPLNEQIANGTDIAGRVRTESFCSIISTDSLDRQIINDMTMFLTGPSKLAC